MKTFIILLVFGYSVAFCQESQCIQQPSVMSPFNVIGDKTLHLPVDYFPQNMKGIASVILIVDSNCTLLNIAICNIRVVDEESGNILSYSDRNINKMLSKNRIYVFKNKYYPQYIQQLYELIVRKIKTLKIEFSDNKKKLKHINYIIETLNIE
jgi:hypothetical protein